MVAKMALADPADMKSMDCGDCDRGSESEVMPICDGVCIVPFAAVFSLDSEVPAELHMTVSGAGSDTLTSLASRQDPDPPRSLS